MDMHSDRILPPHGCRECTVTLAINPGDRDFRVAAIERR